MRLIIFVHEMSKPMQAASDVPWPLRKTGLTAKRGSYLFAAAGPPRESAAHRLTASSGSPWEKADMLHYAIVFFIIAIIAAILGFGGIAASAAGIAKILFFVFLILALVTFLRRA
jgi:uncharacterized membrane protein YtjA (UPF0391 family)